MKIINFKKKKNEIINKTNSRNYMKMQKVFIFGKKILKTNISQIKSIAKLEIIAIIQVNTEVLHLMHLI